MRDATETAAKIELPAVELREEAAHPLAAAVEEELAAPLSLPSRRKQLEALAKRPDLVVVLGMPVIGFGFVGLFLGEIIGLILGTYFAGLNVLMLWDRLVAPLLRPRTKLIEQSAG